ncbi:MAG: hydroxyphenylacetyl-CoA thioesterase PaaI [Rhodobacteraceae bacterium]|nr:hydroxyphenylacetyl-CoA thioesterase PaaI [Paracoccaceae bacterium]
MSLTPQERAEGSAAVMTDGDSASRLLGLKLERVGPGEAEMSLVVDERHLNGHNICHGGCLFALADSTFAFACNSYNQSALAQHCSVTYLHPVRSGDRLIATATEVSRVGRNGIYDIVVTNAAGQDVAQFRGHSRTVKGTHFDEDES